MTQDEESQDNIQHNPPTSIWKKIFKWFAISLAGLLILIFILLYGVLKLPFIQQKITDYAVSFLKEKIDTKVELKKIALDFPKSLVIGGVYLEDEQQDTLLFLDRLSLDIDFETVFYQKIAVNHIEITGLTSNIIQGEDSLYNFSYITEAFASDSVDNEQDTTSTAIPPIYIDRILLENVHIVYDDSLSGNFADAFIGHFSTSVDKINLNTNTYHIGKTLLEGSQAVYNLRKAVEQADTVPDTATSAESETLDFDIAVREIGIENVNLRYGDSTLHATAETDIGKLYLTPKKIDLPSQKVVLNKLLLESSEIAYQQHWVDSIQITANSDTLSAPAKKEEVSSGLLQGWEVSLNKIELNKNKLIYDDFNTPESIEGMDFAHLYFSELNMLVQNIFLSDSLIQLDWKKTFLSESSGFMLKELKGKFAITPKSIDIDSFLLSANNSFISNELSLKFPDLLKIGDQLDKLSIDYKLNELRFYPKDALYFSPELKDIPYFNNLSDIKVQAEGNVNGQLNNLSVNDFLLQADNVIRLTSNASIQGLPDVDSLYLNYRLDASEIWVQKLMQYFPDSLLPDNMSLPESIEPVITFNGTLDTFKSDIKLSTDKGKLALNAQMQNSETYQADVYIDSLQLGKVLSDSTIGNLTAELALEGKGLDIEKELTTSFELVIKEFAYNNYHYDSLTLNGTSDKMSAQIQSNILGKGLAYNLESAFDFNKQEPVIKLDGELSKLDLNLLGFMEDTLSVSTKIDVDIKGMELVATDADITFSDIDIVTGKILHQYEELKLVFKSDTTGAEGMLNFDLAEGDFHSNLRLDSVVSYFEDELQNYISHEHKKVKSVNDVNIDFSFNLKNTDELTDGMVKGLSALDFKGIRGRYDDRNDVLEIQSAIANMVYNDIVVDSLLIDINAQKKKLGYMAGVKQISIPGITDIKNFKVFGDIADDTLKVKLNGQNDEGEEWLDINSRLVQDSIMIFSLDDKLTINYQQWKVNPENQVLLDKGLPYFKNFDIHNEFAELNLSSSHTASDTTLSVKVKNLDLNKLTYQAKKDSSYVNGIINMDVSYNSRSVVDADIDFEGAGVFEQVLGNIHIKAHNKTNIEDYIFDVKLDGSIGDMVVKGNYDLANLSAPLAVDIDIQQLNFEPFNPFVKEFLTGLGGGVNGKLVFKGAGEAPISLRGNIDTDEPAFTLAITNTSFTVPEGKFVFDNKGMGIQNFVMKDISGNKASMNGYLLTEDYENFAFDIKTVSDRFELVNSEPSEGAEYFGKFVVSNNTHITGNMLHPVINADIHVIDETDFTYVYLAGGVGELDTGEGVVVFVDSLSAEEDTTMIVPEALSSLTLSAKINIDEGTKINVVVDPQAGDKLVLEGGGALNLKKEEAGDIVLIGDYTIKSGSYELTFFRVIPKKDFEMRTGSRIFWTGDPTNPQVDVSAIYTTKATPLPLVQNQISDSEYGRYKTQKYFQVFLNLEGEMLKPEVSFDLIYPEEKNGKDAQISQALTNLSNDQSELNKQVFSLLMVNTFITSTGGTGDIGSDLVAGTVSSVVLNQLNNLTNQYIQGVDINFDYAQGEGSSSDLGVTVKKQLFNDRLSFSVGGTYAIDSESSQTQQSNTFSPEFELMYNILRDATLKARIYRKTDTEYFQPDVYKNGVSFIYGRKYNYFKELFQKNVEKKKDIRRRIGRIKRSGQGEREESKDEQKDKKDKVESDSLEYEQEEKK